MIHRSNTKGILHDLLDPIHLHCTNLFRIRLVRVQKLAENDRFRLDLAPVENAAGVDSNGVVAEKCLVAAVRSQARGVGDEAAKKRSQDGVGVGR